MASVECQIDEIVLRGPRDNRVFLMKVPVGVDKEIFREIYKSWRDAWNGDPPRLLVLPDSLTLESLTDDQLKAAGLMKIPK